MVLDAVALLLLWRRARSVLDLWSWSCAVQGCSRSRSAAGGAWRKISGRRQRAAWDNLPRRFAQVRSRIEPRQARTAVGGQEKSRATVKVRTRETFAAARGTAAAR